MAPAGRTEVLPAGARTVPDAGRGRVATPGGAEILPITKLTRGTVTDDGWLQLAY